MSTKLLSLVTGTARCQAFCPFCVSAIRGDKAERLEATPINVRNLRKALQLAVIRGVDTAMLTSRGEPLFYPEQIDLYMNELRQAPIPFVELQTNGLLIADGTITQSDLAEWYDAGLTHVCISVVGSNYALNSQTYTPGREYPDLGDTVEAIQRTGLAVRLTCVLCAHDPFGEALQEARDFIMMCKELGVEQATIRPLNREPRRPSADEWIKQHMLSAMEKRAVYSMLEKDGTLLKELPFIGSVWDYEGQNVMLSFTLDQYTRTATATDSRQLIFFPDGHIYEEWEKEGSILL